MRMRSSCDRRERTSLMCSNQTDTLDLVSTQLTGTKLVFARNSKHKTHKQPRQLPHCRHRHLQLLQITLELRKSIPVMGTPDAGSPPTNGGRRSSPRAVWWPHSQMNRRRRRRWWQTTNQILMAILPLALRVHRWSSARSASAAAGERP